LYIVHYCIFTFVINLIYFAIELHKFSLKIIPVTSITRCFHYTPFPLHAVSEKHYTPIPLHAVSKNLFTRFPYTPFPRLPFTRAFSPHPLPFNGSFEAAQ